MSSEFLERQKEKRDKRKGLLALLLLLLRWRRGTGALLLIILLIMWLIVGPRNLMALVVAGISRFPGGAHAVAGLQWAAAKAGLGRAEEKHSFKELLAGFKAAREARDSRSGWASFFGGPAGRAPGAGASSLGYIRGGADDAGAGANLAAKVKGGKTVQGVLTPEESKLDGASAVALSEGDLRGERAEAAGPAGPSGAAGEGMATGFTDATGLLGGSGAYTTKNFFGTGAGQAYSGARSDSTTDRVKTALDSAKVPGVNTMRFPNERGRLSRAALMSIQSSRYRGALINRSPQGIRALAQLATGRVHAMVARTPYCAPENGCPQEFAATHVGAVFDGNNIGSGAPQVLQTDQPQLEGSEVPSAPGAPGMPGIPPMPDVPSQEEIDAMVDEANEAVEAAERCIAAMDGTRPAQEQMMGCIHYWSDRMTHDDYCEDCDHKDQCEWMGDQMKNCCHGYEAAMADAMAQCPPDMVNQGQGQSMCNQ